jgi:hypothetical protein
MPVEPKRQTAVISNTSVDLPEHRQQAMDACLHQGTFPNYGLPDDVKQTYREKHRLHWCTDSRAGHFLWLLAQVCASRVLISTRLYPAELHG